MKVELPNRPKDKIETHSKFSPWENTLDTPIQERIKEKIQI